MLKPQELQYVLRDVARGLHSLHTADMGSVVHGSVEAEHIYRDIKSGTWKLGSFGAAQRSSDKASDIWQFGVLLLTLLFGSTAFDKNSVGSKQTTDGALDSLISSVPLMRPCSNFEARLLLLVSWMLASEPSNRPTAKQVAIFVSKLGGETPAPTPELALSLPALARKDFRALCMALVRRTIRVAIDSIDESGRKMLVVMCGEQALRNPQLLPMQVKQNALSTDQRKYIRFIQSILPSETAIPDKKSLSEAPTQPAQEAHGEALEKKTPDAPALLDLMSLEEASMTQEVNQPQVVQESSVDLLDFVAESKPQEAAGTNFAELEGLGDLFSSPQQAMASPVSQAAMPVSPAQPCVASPASHLAIPVVMPSPQQGPVGMPYAQQNLFGASCPQQPMQMPPMTCMQQNGVASSQNNGFVMPQMPVFQQPGGNAGYATGMTQMAPSNKTPTADPFLSINSPHKDLAKKEEATPKDPFAGFVSF